MTEEIMYRANEDAVLDADAQFNNKALFVDNLGWLLSQTREQVVSCTLLDRDTVAILFEGGHVVHVNIYADSFIAIIKDVIKHV